MLKFALFFLLLSSPKVLSRSLQNEEPALSFKLIHINDIHAHFEEVNVNTGRCHQDQAEAQQCYGGAARIKTMVDRIRSEKPEMDSIFLNAGDYYQGTIWYSLFKYQPVLEIAQRLNYTAMGVGNHDFDDGKDGLIPFVQEVGFPVLASNLNLTLLPDLAKVLPKSKIVSIGGYKVGIIGYITSDRSVYASYNIDKIEFLDEVESVKQEAKRLQSEEGVSIIIATGHAGYDIDLKMAEEIEELDLVVGGHSHTFLFTGEDKPEGSIEHVSGDYPTYVEQPNGRVVPVVQVYCYSKYLGHMELNFDKEGELLTEVNGVGVSFAEPIILNSSIPMDGDILELMETWIQNLTDAGYKEPIANTTVFLSKGDDGYEGNLGNLVTDALRTCAWEDTTIAFQNNGGIRSTLDIGEITGEDVFSVFPFNNTVDRVDLSGQDIREMLEKAIDGVYPNGTGYPGGLVQMSGIQVEYLISNYPGPKVQKIRTLCPNKYTTCEEDEDWCDLNDETVYKVALPSFLADNYDRKNFNIRRYKKKHDVGTMSDYDCLKNHVMKLGTISTQIEGRIVVKFDDSEVTTETPLSTTSDSSVTTEKTSSTTSDTSVTTETTSFITSDFTTEKTSSTTSDNSAYSKNSIPFLVVMLVCFLQKM